MNNYIISQDVKNKKIYSINCGYVIILLLMIFLNILNFNCFTYASEIDGNSALEWSGEQAGLTLKSNVILVGDTYMTSKIEIPKSTVVTIDLNGYMLHGNGESTIIVNSGVLTIKDSRPNFGKHKFKKSTTGPWVLDENGDIEITGGIITGGRDKTSPTAGASGGGAVQQKSNNTSNIVYIEGGTFVGNSSTRAGGAVYGGAVTMNGGRIIGNYANLFGGGVSVSGSFCLNNGIIEQNETNTDSSYNNNPNSSTFYDNASVVIGQSSSFTMNGGELLGNMSTVKTSSGSPKFIMTDGVVNGNFRILNGLKANISGGTINGSIYMKNGSCTVSNSALIYGGENENGGSIHIEGGSFYMEGGTIKDSNATNGGAVYISKGNFIMSNGSIDNCKASNNGGAIYIEGGNIELSGTSIIKNSDAVNGGAIYVSGGNTILNGGTISSSYATNGGGAYIVSGDFTMHDGLIESCTTEKNGGVIYIAKGNFIMESGVLSNNKANNWGGALRVENGNVTIGLETCKGEDQNHVCPIIRNNTAVVNGGAISMGNGILDFFCGNLLMNVSINNQNGNAIHQTGGEINLHGGETQNGFFLTGGTLSDLRDYIRQIRYNTSFEGITYTILEIVDTGTLLELPLDMFERENHHLMGWSLDEVETQGYMKKGEKIYITSNVELYAVWNENNMYMIYIPEDVKIESNGVFNIDVNIETFDENEELTIKLKEIDDKLYLKGKEDIYVEYELLNIETLEPIGNDEVIKRYTKDFIESKKFKMEFKEKPKYAGKYVGKMSFEIEYVTK